MDNLRLIPSKEMTNAGRSESIGLEPESSAHLLSPHF